MRSHLRTLAAALVLSLGAGAAHADKTPDPKHASCFLSRDWQGWTAPESGKGDVLYIKVNLHDYYRVELTPGSHAHKYPGAFLVNEVRGSNWICSALDLDLHISDDLGFRQPLIARSMRKLTPAEVAAIPRKDLP
jgi:hypothetical protein